MLTVEYAKIALKNKYYLERGWLLLSFSIILEDSIESIEVKTNKDFLVPKRMKLFGDDLYVFIEEDGNTSKYLIEDYIPGRRLFELNKKLKIDTSFMSCVDKEYLTTYGILFINALLLEYPFEGKIKYVNEEFKGSKVNNLVYKSLISDKHSTAEQIKYENAVTMLEALTQTAVPTFSRKSITINPQIKIEKDRLMKEHADDIFNPDVIDKIQKRLEALDKEYLDGDPAERFVISEKAKTSRLKVTGLLGAEQDFINPNQINVIHNSLSEGWKIKDIPKLANNIRAGSHNRGVNTALAGTLVKEVGRSLQNFKIETTFCGTKDGLDRIITDKNFNKFVGRYIVGEDKPLDTDKLKSLIGKKITIHSIKRCLSPDNSCCSRCIGDNVVGLKTSISLQEMEVVSVFMDTFMSLMHATKLKMVKFNYLERIR